MGPDRSIVDYSRIQVDRTKELAYWIDTLRGLTKRVKTAYGYVNNHFAGHSPATIRMLQEGLGMPVVRPDRMGEQLGLF
jgi:uncharacterized protein YecE (DUF72 family)